MKKSFQIIGTLTLIWFSLLCTEKTSLVIKNTDEIMLKIEEEKEKYNINYIDSLIIKDTIIPGLSGIVVDVEGSYKKMKRLGKYDPSLYVYNKQTPSISIYNNYDKYIVKGNSKKRSISFVFYGKIDEIKQIHKLLVQNSIEGTYMLQDINSYNELSSYIDKDFDLVIDKKINIRNTNTTVYCYNSTKNQEFLNYCSSNKFFSILPTLTIKNDLYVTIKNNLQSGLIVLLYVNETTKFELSSVINYLKSKGYEFTNITNLISE